MSTFITGREALIALANGEDVEYKLDKSWFDAVYLSAFDFLSGNYKFRIKSRTINLNGIEIPVPFKPKTGDMVWCLNELAEKGYEARTAYDEEDFVSNIGYWRSESDVEQVVGVLRSVLKTD